MFKIHVLVRKYLVQHDYFSLAVSRNFFLHFKEKFGLGSYRGNSKILILSIFNMVKLKNFRRFMAFKKFQFNIKQKQGWKYMGFCVT